MTDGVGAGAAGFVGTDVPGSVRIATTALVRTAQTVAADALLVPVREVRARVTDDGRGALAVDITGPLTVPVLGSRSVQPEPVIASTHRARGVIADRVKSITGRQVSRVSVTYTSSVVDVPKRVR